MVPRLARGGCRPIPRKLRNASMKMAEGISMVTVTRMDPMALGIRCWNRMVLADEPMVLAASTNSCCFKLSTCPRTTLAISTQYTLPRATMML